MLNPYYGYGEVRSGRTAAASVFAWRLRTACHRSIRFFILDASTLNRDEKRGDRVRVADARIRLARCGMRLTFHVAPPGGWYAVPRVSAWLAVPLAVIVGVPGADLFLAPDIHLAHLLAVAPAFTAAVAGTRLTAAVSVLAALALIGAGAERDTLTTESVLVELGSLIALSALLVLFSVFRDRRTRELARVRRVSDATQRGVLRPLPARAGPPSIAPAHRALHP